MTFRRVSNSKLKRRVFKICKTKLWILVGAVLRNLNEIQKMNVYFKMFSYMFKPITKKEKHTTTTDFLLIHIFRYLVLSAILSAATQHMHLKLHAYNCLRLTWQLNNKYQIYIYIYTHTIHVVGISQKC